MPMLKRFIALFIPVIAFLLLRIFVSFYQADVYSEKSKNLFDAGKISDAMYYADLAVKKNPYEPLYYRNRVRISLALLASLDNKDKYAEVKESIKQDLDTSYALNPDNLVTVRNCIPLYMYLALSDLSLPSFEPNNIDLEYKQVARDYYLKIYDMAPNDVGFYATLARVQKRLGLREDYENSVKKIKELRPDILDWFMTE